MSEVERRAQLAAEGLLSNERLTEDLRDEAARALLDWGIALVEAAAQSTAGMDEAAAEERMGSRVRVIRQLMRRVNEWVAGRREMATEERVARLEEIVQHAVDALGEDFAPPDEGQLVHFAHRSLCLTDAQVVSELQALL
jgi:hypothetical protein